MDRLVETKSDITFQLPAPGATKKNSNLHVPTQKFRVVPGKVNKVPEAIWQQLMKKHGSEGASPLELYLLDGTIVEVSSDRANALVGGARPVSADVKHAPTQAAAEAYARARKVLDADQTIDAEERDQIAQRFATEAAEGALAHANMDPQAPIMQKQREHGKAYDSSEVTLYPGETS